MCRNQLALLPGPATGLADFCSAARRRSTRGGEAAACWPDGVRGWVVGLPARVAVAPLTASLGEVIKHPPGRRAAREPSAAAPPAPHRGAGRRARRARPIYSHQRPPDSVGVRGGPLMAVYIYIYISRSDIYIYKTGREAFVERERPEDATRPRRRPYGRRHQGAGRPRLALMSKSRAARARAGNRRARVPPAP